jgi:hypothetical protein
MESIDTDSGDRVDLARVHSSDQPTNRVDIEQELSLADGPTVVRVLVTDDEGDQHETSFLVDPESGEISMDGDAGAVDSGDDGDADSGSDSTDESEDDSGDESSDGQSGSDGSGDGGDGDDEIGSIVLGDNEWGFEFPTGDVVAHNRDVRPPEDSISGLETFDFTLIVDSVDMRTILDSPAYLDAVSELSVPDGDNISHDGSGGRNAVIITSTVSTTIPDDLYIVTGWSISPIQVSRWEVELSVQRVPETRQLDIVNEGEGFGLSVFGTSPFGY